MTELQQPPPFALDNRHATLVEHARQLIANADAPNTRRAYASDLAGWIVWADQNGVDPKQLPIAPEVVIAWLSAQSLSGLRSSTLRRRASWLSRVHRDAGLTSPISDPRVSTLLRGVRRSADPVTRKAPLTVSILQAAIPHLGVRDRALLLVGFVTGLRRSELAALRWGSIEPSPSGRVIVLGRTKTGEPGELVGLPRGVAPYCPVAALRALELEQGEPGPIALVFGCGAQAISRTVKLAAKIAGEDPKRYGGHSLRAGFATEAARLGQSLPAIMAQTRHASADVAAGYVRHSEADRNPCALALTKALAE
jgi:integrase